ELGVLRGRRAGAAGGDRPRSRDPRTRARGRGARGGAREPARGAGAPAAGRGGAALAGAAGPRRLRTRWGSALGAVAAEVLLAQAPHLAGDGARAAMALGP